MMLLETCSLLPLLRRTYRTARLRYRTPIRGLVGTTQHQPVRVGSVLLSGTSIAYSTTRISRSISSSSSSSSTKCVVLSDLSYVAVTGTDARRFLQGICTNDITISKLKPAAAGDCIATSLLNNKGRILFNLLLYTLRDKNKSGRSSDNSSSVDVVSSSSSDGLFLLAELHTHNVAEFQRYLNLYKLRSKVDIRVVEADCLFINSTFNADQLASLNDCSPDVLVAAIDPRLEGFGTRVVIDKHALHSLSLQTKELLHIRGLDDASASASGGDSSRLVRWYHRYKTLHGVLDGPEALSMIPFECNLDALNYVSFSKGCYIGQELMARTKFKGVVRKRLLPFIYCSIGGGHSSSSCEDLQREVLSEDYPCYNDDDGVAAVGGGSLGPHQQQQQQSERSGPALGDAIYLSRRDSSPREGDTDSDSDSDEAISDDKPVGKVVYLDPTGTVGLAMMQLSAVATRTSGSDTRWGYHLMPGTREEVISTDLDPNHSSCEAATTATTSPSQHIHLQLPSWFHRLDSVTGNIH